jgi:hypothetical protein
MVGLRLRRSTPRFRRLTVEFLEARQLLSASGIDTIAPLLISPDISPAATTGTPRGFSPAQIAQAYGFNQIHFGTVKGDGAGQTIAIVDAYNDPNLRSDLAAFDQKFGVAAPPSLTIVNQTGGSMLPSNNRGWASEIALDVEWAHAIAPGANILVVEANSATNTALDAAENFARNYQSGLGIPPVTVVSNSWGGSEYSTESSEDVYFTTPSGHAGVTFLVAAGDNGTPAEYPSSSPNVISVGGTSLVLDKSGNWSSETAWSSGGGGVSKYEAKPSWQNGVTTATHRATPDVSLVSNPSTGVAVYDSYGSGGWAVYGGTSIATPQWAGLIAIADQGRALAGKSSLAGAQAALYSLPSSDFHDITSGNNGSPATKGYDLATGLGTPIANLVVQGLVSYVASATTPATSGGGGTITTGTSGTGTGTGGGTGGGTWGGGGWGGGWWGGWSGGFGFWAVEGGSGGDSAPVDDASVSDAVAVIANSISQPPQTFSGAAAAANQATSGMSAPNAASSTHGVTPTSWASAVDSTDWRSLLANTGRDSDDHSAVDASALDMLLAGASAWTSDATPIG